MKKILNVLEDGIKETKRKEQTEKERVETIKIEAMSIAEWLLSNMKTMYDLRKYEKKEFLIEVINSKCTLYSKNTNVILPNWFLDTAVIGTYKSSAYKDTIIEAMEYIMEDCKNSERISITRCKPIFIGIFTVKVEVNWDF